MSKELLFILAALAAAGIAALGETEKPPDCCPQRVDSNECAPVGTVIGSALEVPPEIRERNWGGGSCVHASTVVLLRYHGQTELAEWWRANYSGGENDSRLVKRLEAAGLKYAYTNGDEEFLHWCNRTGRVAGIFYKPNHAINFVGEDEQYVYLLDNNDVDRLERTGSYETVPRAEFYRRWHGYGGFAWTVAYLPPPAPSLN